MSNHIDHPAASQDEAENLKNVLGKVAAKPFYIWANEDCANKTDDFKEAKVIRLALINAGGVSVHIVDADGVEVMDVEIECHEGLAESGYFAGVRNPEVNPGFAGAFMVNDPQDPEGFAIVGDDVGALILEARAQLIDPPVNRWGTTTAAPEDQQAVGKIDIDFERLNTLLDVTGCLDSVPLQRCAYQLRLSIAQALGDQARIDAAKVSLKEIDVASADA